MRHNEGRRVLPPSSPRSAGEFRAREMGESRSRLQRPGRRGSTLETVVIHAVNVFLHVRSEVLDRQRNEIVFRNASAQK